ncbi:MAG: hypothetical protein DMG59_13585 [Acidobacteria bacterium]|nr:MAG: hypothetical protein DMG59_13585 [Acidobacteriota bacterium]
MRRFDSPGCDFLLIALMHEVNESPVPFRRGVEIMTKASINERINNISKGDKTLEMKVLDQ